MKDAGRPLSMVIADDHPVVLHGIVALMRSCPDLIVLGACSTGAEAVEAIRKFQPDIAVLDIAMPDMSGLDVLSSLAEDGSKTKFVLLTATASDAQILTAIAFGAKGIMLKDAPPKDLIQCVIHVGAGGSWFPPDVVDSAFERETGRKMEPERVAQDLTPREQQVMMLVSQGLSNKEIAIRLGLAEGTIKIHVHNIFEKLGVRNRTSLTAFAIANRELLAEKL
jgi:DNA-binding NarL/FixJ family response regulator